MYFARRIKMYIFLLGIILLVLFIHWNYGLKKEYKKVVLKAIESESSSQTDIITEGELKDLPIPLQKYLKNTGIIGKAHVKYFHVQMTGGMRLDKDQALKPCKVDQYTFTESGRRLFYMTMKIKGISISGLHHYNALDAFMKIKILDLLKIVDHSGQMMQRAETVTYFNDLCLMAPGALLREDIDWETIDPDHVKGTLRKHGHQVSAILSFNDLGMLDNFISEDRMVINKEGQYIKMPWSTPMHAFGPVGDYYLPKEGQAVWHYPQGDFSYIKLKIDNVSINQV